VNTLPSRFVNDGSDTPTQRSAGALFIKYAIRVSVAEYRLRNAPGAESFSSASTRPGIRLPNCSRSKWTAKSFCAARVASASFLARFSAFLLAFFEGIVAWNARRPGASQRCASHRAMCHWRDKIKPPRASTDSMKGGRRLKGQTAQTAQREGQVWGKII